jgi:glucosamine--fructose-6-phosphate aminotransferase (isomerizing)
MCGIIGYVGHRNAVPLLVEGLKRLEYRGYDSAGIAFLQEGKVEVRRCVGKLVNLEKAIQDQSFEGSIGIGHTRWATHGKPSEENAHPHRVGGLVVVHNGIIENFLVLKRELLAEGKQFSSDTDTEVIVHLIDRALQKVDSLEAAVQIALGQIRGAYALLVLSESHPNHLIAARNGCPLVVGIGKGEFFAASDIPAILNHTRKVLYLHDGEFASLSPSGVVLKTLDGKIIERGIDEVTWNPVMAEKGGYRHFMLKEIHEQPRAMMDTIRGRVNLEKEFVELEEMGFSIEKLKKLKRVTLVACGTSWHAALVGKFLIEKLGKLPVEVDIGSEFRYRDPLVGSGDVLVAISQSGETADTLAAMREASKKGAHVISICNVVGSTIARESQGVIYTHAGPEIGVASTKAFTSQLMALYLLALYLGRVRGTLGRDEEKMLIKALVHAPQWVEEVLQKEEKVQDIARRFFQFRDFLYLGRGVNYPVALEGALKLKEISYIHAEGYPAGEMKHGPIALIDENMPVVFIMKKF